MGRMLYWHLSPQEVSSTAYQVEKLIHWEIRGGFSEESYFSVFWFRGGILHDKEPINGIAMYAVECGPEIVNSLEDFLVNMIGGNVLKKGHRTFLSGAKITLDNKFIANLATQVMTKFGVGGEIWLEFDGLMEEEQKQLFPSKSLQIAK